MVNWLSLLHVGLHRVHLTPQQFWQLTPAELMIMAGLYNGNTSPLKHADLLKMMQTYPDRPQDNNRT